MPHPQSANEPSTSALDYFHASSFCGAVRSARAVLRDATSCPRCSRALAHLYDRLGSTLFRDDDPHALIRAFHPEERNSCTLQVIAACIVLHGRDRVVPAIH